MRRLVTIGAALGLASTGLLLGSVAAGASDSYCSMRGCTQAQTETICAGHGSFGAFGKDENFAGGADGQLTGYYNSALCGSPAGNP